MTSTIFFVYSKRMHHFLSCLAHWDLSWVPLCRRGKKPFWPIFCQTKFGQSMIFGCHKHEKEEENGFLFIFREWKRKVLQEKFLLSMSLTKAGVTLGSWAAARNSLSFFLSPTPKPMLDYANAHTHKNTQRKGGALRVEEASKGSFQERDE